jgi:hypothetical protein
MAIFPCDLGTHRYSGAQQTIYPALTFQGDAYRRKLRLCPSHMRTRLDALERNAQNAQIDFEVAQTLACIGCGNVVTDSEWQFFATVYERGQDRRDFWAPVCVPCVASVAEDWLLEPQMA